MTKTKIFILICTSVIIVFDLWALFFGVTISEVITRSSQENIIIPFAFGVLMGHWFWGKKY